MARRPYRGMSLERALETPGQTLMRENRERAGRLALQRIKDAEARKHAEGDTDANHDNEEKPQ
jgi:hypothetical protein